MALTSDLLLSRRGGAASRNEFAYPVEASTKLYRGSLIALKSNGRVVRVGDSGAAVFLGVCDRQLDNSANAGASVERVVGQKGTWPLVVPAATVSNIGAAVYATDDATLTLTAGSNLQVGTLAGIENGKTYVNIIGS